jgi:hypothetical protein
MDGRERALGNVTVERLWRRVKYEEIYLWDYADGTAAWQGLSWYFPFNNNFYRLVCHTCPVSPASSRFNPTVAEQARTQK